MREEIINNKEQILKNFNNRVKVSKPSFTNFSFNRTIENTIVESLNLGFLTQLKQEDIEIIKNDLDISNFEIRKGN